ncbi:ATP-binding protein [Flaviaesturariibacter amylovorans]|uniref:ATP-binding protein n=1 Tax=Flaviaesturariibacter amylovorans TaxID=1084520 RepID=A0ABP8HI95_9BACT
MSKANNLPKIGKTVLETLTSGMYDDPRFIYREYIQNAVDQIDEAVDLKILKRRSEGEVLINIDSQAGYVVIEDNATGIKASMMRRFLSDVANSEKDPTKRKGFRGIGRLGGLGYSEKLIFETSYKGELVKSIMTLDSANLGKIIANRQDDSDAAQVISIITTVTTNSEKADAHYFRVILSGVKNEAILNIDSVYSYLSIVAPVPFDSDFAFRDRILSHFESRGLKLDEYKVRLNKKIITKAYKNNLLDSSGQVYAHITSIGFFDVKDQEDYLLALGWYGIPDLVNKVIEKENIERGIRIRSGNIGVGDEKTLMARFKVERTNLRYIGEVHIVGEGFTPNARRDYFNDNRTVSEFQSSLESIFTDFENRLPHRASDLHNRSKEIKVFRSSVESFRKELPAFKTAVERDQRFEELEKALSVAKKASKKIQKIKEEAQTSPPLNDLFKSIIHDFDFDVTDKEISEFKSAPVYPPLKFRRVTADQSKILNEVVIFLQQELGHSGANKLIQKLQKKYDK